MKRISLLCMLFVATSLTLSAQIRTPSASPGSKIDQSIGLTSVIVDYSRPSAKGRKVFGDLVPFGQLWRTAANQGTKVTFNDDVKIDGKDLKKGKYALFTIPGEMDWKIIFHKNADLNVPGGADYKESDEALRISVKPNTAAAMTESFTIGFDQLKDAGAEMYIAWEKTKVSFNIDAMTDGKVMAGINQVMSGPSANDYMAAANYYSSAGKDMAKAVEWAAKGVSMGANQYWNLRAYSLILAKSGKYADAIAAAKESLTKATEAKNGDYIKMNETSIAEWGKMKK